MTMMTIAVSESSDNEICRATAATVASTPARNNVAKEDAVAVRLHRSSKRCCYLFVLRLFSLGRWNNRGTMLQAFQRYSWFLFQISSARISAVHEDIQMNTRYANRLRTNPRFKSQSCTYILFLFVVVVVIVVIIKSSAAANRTRSQSPISGPPF